MAPALERAVRLMDMADLGQCVVTEGTRLTDLTLLRIAKRSWRSYEAVLQGRLVANEIAKVFGQMFGGRRD